MSSEPRAGAPSPEPAEPIGDAELAALVRSRGAPLVEALAAQRPEAIEHARGTAAYAFAAAAELGLGRDRCEAVREAAMLHDAGQVYVAAAVLAKPAIARDSDEQQAFEAHYEAGYRLARGAGVPERACEWLLRQRERYDGAGPERLAGDAIPVESRLIRAACACQHALSEPSGGGEPSPSEALGRLTGLAGDELDPRVVGALVAAVERAVRSAAPQPE